MNHWSPCATEDVSGLKLYLLDSMCDLDQFAVSSSIGYILSEALEQLFMADVLWSFGM